MWIAKFKFRHNCPLGNRCQKFKVSLQSVGFSVFKKRGRYVNSSLHYASGDEKNINKFIQDLSKDKAVIKLERKNNMFFLIEKAEEKAAKFFTPKIIFVKPVLINTDGFENWEISSWEKEEVSNFIEKVEKTMPEFELLKFYQTPLNNVFFPRLMPNLTEKQRRAIELAISNGYYASPRKIDLRKLAKIMGISLATYQQHLRASEEKLIPNLLHYSN